MNKGFSIDRGGPQQADLAKIISYLKKVYSEELAIFKTTSDHYTHAYERENKNSVINDDLLTLEQISQKLQVHFPINFIDALALYLNDYIHDSDFAKLLANIGTLVKTTNIGLNINFTTLGVVVLLELLTALNAGDNVTTLLQNRTPILAVLEKIMNDFMTQKKDNPRESFVAQFINDMRVTLARNDKSESQMFSLTSEEAVEIQDILDYEQVEQYHIVTNIFVTKMMQIVPTNPNEQISTTAQESASILNAQILLLKILAEFPSDQILQTYRAILLEEINRSYKPIEISINSRDFGTKWKSKEGGPTDTVQAIFGRKPDDTGYRISASNFVSRTHFSIAMSLGNNKQFSLADLGSTYGTRLRRGDKISNPLNKNEYFELSDGDIIILGSGDDVQNPEYFRFNYDSNTKTITLTPVQV